MAQHSKPLLRLRQTALRLQDRLRRVRALRKPHTHFIEARCPAHSSPVAPFGFVGPGLPPPPPPPSRPPLHFHGPVFQASGILQVGSALIQGFSKKLSNENP